MFKASNKSVGTVCFPTYNRANLLLPTLEKVLPNVSVEWPILILDNASNQEAHIYDKVKDIAKSHPQVHYYKHQKNLLFEGNLLSMFDLVPTDYFMVCSDEDEPCFDGLSSIASFLSGNRDIGAIRPSLGTLPNEKPRQAISFKEKSFERSEGVGKFGLTGNYISGAIYNAKLLKKFNVPQRLRKNLLANQGYPHLYLNILAAANSKTLFSNTVTCFEGIQVYNEPRLFTDYFGAFSYGTRINQFIALRNAIFEAYVDIQAYDKDKKVDFGKFYLDYQLLCSKYFSLIMWAQGSMYQKNMITVASLAKSFALFCIGAVEHLPHYERIKKSLANEVFLLAEYWIDKHRQDSKSTTMFYDVPGNAMVREKTGFTALCRSTNNKAS